MKFFFLIVSLIILTSCASKPEPRFLGRHPYFAWPVKKGVLTQKYKHGSRKHDGIDIAARKNTSIYAAEAGRVLYAGRDFSGYGKLIIIEHGSDQWASFYAHLNDFKVSEGQKVSKGQLIGLMGKTGRASGVHLHFEIRHNLRPVDPLNFLSRKAILSKR